MPNTNALRLCLLALFIAHCAGPDEDVHDELDVGTKTAASRAPCEEALGSPAQWVENERISPCGRTNPLALANPEVYAAAGRKHALNYPVETTGIVVPWRPLRAIMEGETESPVRKFLAWLVPKITGMHGVNSIFDRLGLVKDEDGNYWGATVLDTPRGEALTFSCATCHSGSVFGTPVLGLHNRRSRANYMFEVARPAFKAMTPGMFNIFTGATDGEVDMYRDARQTMNWVKSKEPSVVGLDTALAHTMLSLMHREPGEWAERTETAYKNPRYNPLETHPVDVKPATWWLTKYKNKFFSDGSQVSGNPVLGALLVNEMGRGADLHQLDRWIDDNWQTVEEYTTAVFSTTAPSYFDFFDAARFDIAAAKRGQAVFAQNCQRCHGAYAKGWEEEGAEAKTVKEQLATVDVRYFENSVPRDVGTDSNRAKGIAYMQEINELAIAKKHHLVLSEQVGYVPPPLVGIWARWPYFHNGAAPSLCAVLTRAIDRPAKYTYGDIRDRDTEFDADCNGYPKLAPRGFDDVYDTSVPGLANTGHDEGIFVRDGKELLTAAQKSDLIRFLQTL